MTLIDELLMKASELGSSDLHITVAVPPTVRVNGDLRPLEGYHEFLSEDTEALALCLLSEHQKADLETNGQIDFSYVVQKIGRFRINIYKQRRSYCIAIRLLSMSIPSIDTLNLPPILKELSLKKRGLILVTGPTGSGKTTTLAAMVDCINNSKRCHVLTIEDPIEYLHKHGKSMINQREVGDDTFSFASALRASLREDPDVILVGEMRDLETISTALSAAETGHLVLSTLHTIGAAQTIDRIIDMFPPYQQTQVRVQLASVLQAVISQQLVLDSEHARRIPALEILIMTDAVRNLIRENKCHQIPTAMQTGIKQGMVPMDFNLAQLVKSGLITQNDAFAHCMEVETLRRYLNY